MRSWHQKVVKNHQQSLNFITKILQKSLKNRKKIEVGGPRAIFFEFERQKSDFESEVGFLRSNFGYFLKFSEILERTRKSF